MIRVVIVDDVPILRESFKLLIEKDSELKVVGIAKDGREAYNICNALVPDVVLMDIVMPICDGLESTKIIKANNKSIKVIMLTTFEDEDKISNALKSGADGYVLKDISPEALRLVIRSAKEGMPIIHPKVFDTMIKQFDGDYPRTETNDYDIFTSFKGLSDKEKNIVKLIVQGKCNKDIATMVYLSEGRVKNVVSEILYKLGLNDRTQLAVFAVKNKLV
jgi:DNA-binding NarL/FixJ family response regulator